MKRNISISAYIFLAIFFFLPLPGDAAKSVENPVSGTGEIVFVDLEGGFFGIVADDGQRFDPLNLDTEFRVSGLKVRFLGSVRKNVIGFHMWGTPLELIQIEKLSP